MSAADAKIIKEASPRLSRALLVTAGELAGLVLPTLLFLYALAH